VEQDLFKNIENLLLKETQPRRHSFFQLEYFVVGKEPTTQAKLHRCLEELSSKNKDRTSLSLEIEETNDKIKILEEKIKIEANEFQINHLARNKVALEEQLLKLKQNLIYLEEEMEFLFNIYNKLVQKEPLKPWDDYEVQKEYWNAKLSQDIKIRLLLGQPIGSDLVSTILALPDNVSIKNQTMELLNKQSEQLNNKDDNR